MCCNFSAIYIKLYPVYGSSDFILNSSSSPFCQPCYGSLLYDAIVIISSSIKISTTDKEVSAILIAIRPRIKSNISIVSSSRNSRNIYLKNTFTSQNHCISTDTTSEHSYLPARYLIYRSTTKYMKKVRIEAVQKRVIENTTTLIY